MYEGIRGKRKTTGEYQLLKISILLKIINRSLETGIFPENWKESIVVEKIRNTIKCEEYCLINTLRTCEKIIEKIVKNQLKKIF